MDSFWKGVFSTLVLLIVIVFLYNIFFGKPDDYDAAQYQKQLEIHEQQVKEFQTQQLETKRQLEESANQQKIAKAQSERIEALLKRWEAQADRYDAILTKWEKIDGFK
ncbi:MAG: hypothetical protein V6Z89_01270 [Desulfobacter sp.]